MCRTLSICTSFKTRPCLSELNIAVSLHYKQNFCRELWIMVTSSSLFIKVKYSIWYTKHCYKKPNTLEPNPAGLIYVTTQVYKFHQVESMTYLWHSTTHYLWHLYVTITTRNYTKYSYTIVGGIYGCLKPFSDTSLLLYFHISKDRLSWAFRLAHSECNSPTRSYHTTLSFW